MNKNAFLLTVMLALIIGFALMNCGNLNSPNLDGTVKSILVSSKSFPTNVVFLGDGFTEMNNVDNGLFDRKISEIYNYIFSIQPFSKYKEYFSVYKVYAASNNKGAKNNPNDSTPKTVFNSTYNYMGIERLLVAQDRAKVIEYARLATDSPHLIIVLVNDTRYGGSGGEFAVVSIHQQARGIAVHELGHIFGLADEYVDEQYRQAAGITLAQAAQKPNVDTTNNLTAIKWSHFIGLPGYNDTAWEGGFYFATGVWRPTRYSIMESWAIMEFNAISRETIVKRIINNAGETYNLSDFLSRDTPPVNLSLRASVVDGSGNPMPVPIGVYAGSLFANQKIRARFRGEVP